MKDQTGNHELVLPKGWIVERLGLLAEKITKGATPTTYGYAFQNTGINFIKVQNVSDGAIDLTSITDFISEEAHQNQRKSILNVNDVLFSIAGTIGETAIVKQQHLPANTNQAFAIISGFSKLLLPKYLEFQLRSFVTQKTKNKARGGAMNNVSLDDLKNLMLLLPPLAEQHRIVAKIEALFSELDKGIESFKTAREQLKIYRQALLKHAFSGKLTAQWRAENAAKLESAETVLQRIQTERQQRYQQQLKDWEDKSPSIPLLQRGKRAANQQPCTASTTIPPFEKGGLGGISKPKPPKTLPPLTAEELAELPELPEGWAWVKLGQLTWSVKDGPHFSPKYSDSGIPFISGGNVRPEGVDFENTKFISQELHEELCKRCKPEINDILYTKGGTTGIARVNTYDKEFSVWVHVAVLKLIDSVRPFFLQHSLNSNFCYTQAQKYTHGVGNQDLGLTRMVNIVLAICHLDEQDEVVQIIEDKISICDQLDQTITTALQQAEALRQSILKKAFSGQLVPQDPNDEPASVLLERIRAEKAQADKQPACRRGKTA